MQRFAVRGAVRQDNADHEDRDLALKVVETEEEQKSGDVICASISLNPMDHPQDL